MFIRLATGNLEVTMMMTMVTNYKENTLTQCITIETASSSNFYPAERISVLYAALP